LRLRARRPAAFARRRVGKLAHDLDADAGPLERPRHVLSDHVVRVLAHHVGDRLEARHDLDAHGIVADCLGEVVAGGSVGDVQAAGAAAEDLPFLLRKPEQRVEQQFGAVGGLRRFHLDRHPAGGKADPDRAPRAERLVAGLAPDPGRQPDDAALPRFAGQNGQLPETAEKERRARLAGHGVAITSRAAAGQGFSRAGA
jgi:hypothetical protein